MRWPLRG